QESRSSRGRSLPAVAARGRTDDPPDPAPDRPGTAIVSPAQRQRLGRQSILAQRRHAGRALSPGRCPSGRQSAWWNQGVLPPRALPSRADPLCCACPGKQLRGPPPGDARLAVSARRLADGLSRRGGARPPSPPAPPAADVTGIPNGLRGTSRSSDI